MNTRYKLKQKIINQENRNKLKMGFDLWNNYINHIDKPDYNLQTSKDNIELNTWTNIIMNWFRYRKMNNNTPTVNDLDKMGFNPVKMYTKGDYYGNKLYTIRVDNGNYIDAVVYDNMVIYVELLSNNNSTTEDDYIDFTETINKMYNDVEPEYNKNKEKDIYNSENEDNSELDEKDSEEDGEDDSEEDGEDDSEDDEDNSEDNSEEDEDNSEDNDSVEGDGDSEENKNNLVGVMDYAFVPICIGLLTMVVTYLNHQSKYYNQSDEDLS